MIRTSPKPLPRIIPRLKTGRLPKRNRMTLVAAFRCSKGGVLLCADREEDDGYAKREVEKIYRIPATELQSCDVFLAGAGPSSLVVKAHDVLHSRLLAEKIKGTDLVAEHVCVIEASLKIFYRSYASELKNAAMGFIVVVAPLLANRVPMLYRTERAMMVPEPYYIAYGSGKPLCDYFSDRLYAYGQLDKNAMKILVAFILRETEKAASGVGMGANMRFIHEGDQNVHHLSSGTVKELQDCIPSLQDSIWDHWKANVKVPSRLAG